MTVEKYISPFIQSHFPELYKEYGPNFVAFTRAYYEWMESSGNPLGHSRNMYEYSDVDNTIDTFVKYFKNKYMLSMPESMMADKRMLVKHILDLYKSKGSLRAYELLFRILFNEDIQVYVPGKDLFRLSNNQYIRPIYVETSYNPYLRDLVGKTIYDSLNEGTAVVENYFTKLINNKSINVLTLSSVTGNFKYGHKITCDDLYVDGNGSKLSRYEYNRLTSSEQGKYRLAITIDSAPIVLGSLTSVGVINGGYGFSVGEFLKVNGDGYGGVARVARTGKQNGKVAFTLLDGGSGYSVNAVVTISNTNGGEGASFKVGGLTNIEVLRINTDEIEGFANTTLDDPAEGCNLHLTGVTGTFTVGDVVRSLSNTVTRSLDVTVLTDNSMTAGENLSNTELNISDVNVITNGQTLLTVYGSDITSANLTNGVVLISNTTNSVIRVNSIFSTQNTYGNGTVSYWDSPSGTMKVTGANFGYFVPGTKIVKSDLSANATVSSITRNTDWIFALDSDIRHNLDQEIQLALRVIDLEVGTITYLKEINPGDGYAGDPTVTIVEPDVYELRIPSGSGYKGYNAIVKARAGTADGIVLAVDIYDSGYAYTPASNLALVSISNSQNQTVVTGSSVIDTQGVGSGYFTSRSGFLSDNQHIIDSKYWQMQSYDIIATRMLKSYEDFVRDLVHPAGIALFGTFNVSSEIQNEVATPESFSITVS